jgi:hypothetical protein
MPVEPNTPTDIDPADDYIDPAETAEDLGVTTSTLAGWRCSGRGPDFWKWGRTVKYRESTNAKWKAAQRRSPRRESTAT